MLMFEAAGNQSKLRRFFSEFVLLAFAPIALAAMDPPAIEWEKPIEGKIHDVKQTSDGGFLIAGNTDGGGAWGWNAFVIKTDGQGTETWRKTIHLGSRDSGQRVLQAKDGNYVLLASLGDDSRWTPTLIKLDTMGRVLWQSGSTGVRSYWTAMDETADGGFVIAGAGPNNTGTEMVRYVIRTDAIGDLKWKKYYPGAPPVHDTEARDVDVTSDGGYFIMGNCLGNEPGVNRQMLLLRLDGDGSVIWDRAYADPSIVDEISFSGYQTPDGGFVVTVRQNRLETTGLVVHHICFHKIDANGLIEYERTFPEIGEGVALDIAPTRDGGYALAGTLGSVCWAGRLDAAGALLWHTTLGSLGPGSNSGGWSIQQTSDGGYIVGCMCNNDLGECPARLIKLAPDAPVAVPFVRGRTNGGEQLALDDAICLLNYLFGRSDDPCKLNVPRCLDAADANDDGKVGITDAVMVLLHLFLGGAGLPEPFAACGADPSADDLGCASFSGCS
jgi:hypothetical protein